MLTILSEATIVPGRKARASHPALVASGRIVLRQNAAQVETLQSQGSGLATQQPPRTHKHITPVKYQTLNSAQRVSLNPTTKNIEPNRLFQTLHYGMAVSGGKKTSQVDRNLFTNVRARAW